jgi:hypothetical protein
MTNVKHGFEPQIIEVPIVLIKPGAPLAPTTLSTPKYRTILSSIGKLGIIEPLAVFPSNRREGEYDLLDGRLRLEALRRLGKDTAPCMVSTDDEGFTYNRQVSRTTAVQEHRMIRATLAKGASEQRIAEVLELNVRRIRERAHLLDGIAPEAAALLKDRQMSPTVFSTLRKMRPFRQIEAVEMMIAANRITVTYAEMILATTRSEGLSEHAQPKKKVDVSPEELARMEAEMEHLRQDCQTVEDTAGDTMLSLVVTNGFIARLLRNENIHGHLKRHHKDSLASVVSTMEAIAADNRMANQE